MLFKKLISEKKNYVFCWFFNNKYSINNVITQSKNKYSTAIKDNNTNTNTNSDHDLQKYPLNGIKILDLTRIVAGPYCTQILADLGADVYKVERPFVGDESRRWGPPFLKNSNDSIYFLANNRNKKSVCIDLKQGREIIYELAKHCDVLVENYIPGKLNEFGLGYEQLHKIAPALIYCSITGYGPIGPYAKRPGYDVVAASLGGLLHITGAENGPPSKVGVAITDIATGLYAHGAIMAALLQRARTKNGLGQKIDVNLFSTQIACLINVAVNYLNAGQEAKRWGTAHSSVVPYEAFKTKNGWLTVGAGSDVQFRALCECLQLPEIAVDERFATNQERVKNRQILIDILTGCFVKQNNQHWMDIFENVPFPCAPINTIGEVFSDPHVKAIELVKTLQHPVAGDVHVVGPPVIYSDGMNTARTSPPTLGEHTDEVLRDLLKYDQPMIESLRMKKIIQ